MRLDLIKIDSCTFRFDKSSKRYKSEKNYKKKLVFVLSEHPQSIVRESRISIHRVLYE